MPLVDEQTRALWDAGMWQPVDFVLLAVEFAAGLTTFFWWLFGKPSPVGILAALAIMIGISQLWCLILCYRAVFHALQARADINMMPAAAARIVVAYQTGTPPSKG